MKLRMLLSLALTLGLSVSALRDCPVQKDPVKKSQSCCCPEGSGTSCPTDQSKAGSKNTLCCAQSKAVSHEATIFAPETKTSNPHFAAHPAAAILNPDLTVRALIEITASAGPPGACPLRLTSRAPPV
ncbi:MAG: hypothetical protein A2901_02320 [Elusimicrobia bacterium RIFCSPLOWO2_01_FULL_54_10]|nr:MAG: hypothetical protein A2901_02320 [Elusimicrobia bacterium RIFCSPLOWO2_01_FULL_54_10]